MLAQNAYITAASARPVVRRLRRPRELPRPGGHHLRAGAAAGRRGQPGHPARAAAERARTSAKTRIDEVQKIVDGLGTKRDKITKLVAKVESSLFKRAIGEAGRPAPGPRGSRPAGHRRRQGRRSRQVGAHPAAQALRLGRRGPDLVRLLRAGDGGLPAGGHLTAALHRRPVDGRPAHLQGGAAPGDLVFFYGDLHHVGIYIGGGMMVHAPQTGDVVRIASIASRPFAGAVRIAD